MLKSASSTNHKVKDSHGEKKKVPRYLLSLVSFVFKMKLSGKTNGQGTKRLGFGRRCRGKVWKQVRERGGGSRN